MAQSIRQLLREADRKTRWESLRATLCIATTAIAALPLGGCGAANDRSPATDLVVRKDTAARHHYMAPAGRIEIPMQISAGTIVRGHDDDIGKSGECTVRWTDMEKRDALSGEESRELFLDLPCANLAKARAADRVRRVPYSRMVPAASSPDTPTTMSPPEQATNMALSGPVWACTSEQEYREELGNSDADCVVIYADTPVQFVDPNSDRNSNFYRIRLRVGTTAATYVVHKNDVLLIPYSPPHADKHRTCRTTPQTTCVGNEG